MMAAIVASTEISRSPVDVFSYLTDASHLPEWQESVVGVEGQPVGPVTDTATCVVTRHVGPRHMKMAVEIGNLDPPRSFTVRGLDGPVRGNVKTTVEPLDDGTRSRVTIELDLQGHGIGKVLVPLVARRQAQKELPKNVQTLKALLERGA
jgi:uncharacterized protein YndB with AHSA1/START domain